MQTPLRELVWQRAQSRCKYRIAQDVDPLPFQIDHVIARQHDGPTVAENVHWRDVPRDERVLRERSTDGPADHGGAAVRAWP
jgi:hypothetical protein